jgi:ribosomal protein L33
MITKTCPHCNAVSIDDEPWKLDTGDLAGVLIIWKCHDCGKRFYTEDGD